MRVTLKRGELHAERSARRRRTALAIGWVLALSILIAPLPVAIPPPTLDTMWGAAMVQAYVEHLTWGSQIIWTYGPYGFLDSVYYYYGSTWILSAVVAVAVNIGLLATLAAFLLDLEGPWWTWLALGVGLLLPITRGLGVDTELLLIVMLLLHLAVVSRWRLAALFAIPAGFSLALLALLKGNDATGGLAVVLCFGLVAALRRRWAAPALLVAAAAVSFILLWLTTAPLSAVPGYLRSMYEIVIGYTPAMSVFNEEDTISARHAYVELGIAAVLLLAAGFSVLVTGVRREVRGFSLALLSAPVIFITYKEVFVRYGPDRLPVLYGVVILLSLLLLLQSLVLLRAVPFRFAWAEPVAPAFSLALCVLLLFGLGGSFLQTPYSRDGLSQVPQRIEAYREAARLLRNPDLRAQTDDRVAEKFGAGYHFTPRFLSELRQGTFTAYPIDASLAYAYRFDWDPTPIVQSYQGRRPYLDAADANHLRSRDGPHHVLFAYFGMDGRYPLFDEPDTVRALLYCYRVVDTDGPYLLLQRRAPVCSEPPLHPLGTVTVPLGSSFSIPRADGPVYAAVNVRYSLAGQVADLLYRPSELHVQFEYGSGQLSPVYRYIPAVGMDGILASTYVGSVIDFATLMAGAPGAQVRALRIIGGGREYEPEISVTFSSGPVP